MTIGERIKQMRVNKGYSVRSRYITKSVGREPLRDRYGRPIK